MPIDHSTSAAALGAAAAGPAASDGPWVAPGDEPPYALPRAPANLRSTSLVAIAALACLFVLHWASAVFVPLLLGLMFSYALTPLVNGLVMLHIPRSLAAAALLSAVLGGIGSMAWALSDDAASMIQSLPAAAQKLRRSIEGLGVQGPGASFERVQKAAAELERAADAGPGSSPARGRSVTRVQIEPTRFNVKDYLWTGTLGLAAAVGQAGVVIFITFFLLASGDLFRRKVVRIAGPSFNQRRLTLQALDQIDAQIQRYLLVQVVTSAVVGVATWLAFLWLGVEHAGVWGAATFVLHFIPYFGSIIVTGAAALMAFVQFGAFGPRCWSAAWRWRSTLSRATCSHRG